MSHRHISRVIAGNKSRADGNWIAIAAAAYPSLGIGIKGKLPWKIAADMQYFKEVTLLASSPYTKNVLVMGRKTWESIPSNKRPLPGRVNIILTQNTEQDFVLKNNDTFVANSLSQANQIIDNLTNINKVFVIGGEQVYRAAIEMNLVNEILLTRMNITNDRAQYDAFFPDIENDWICGDIMNEGFDKAANIKYEFLRYSRRRTI